MPPVGNSEPDPEGIALISSWIESLPQRGSFKSWLESKGLYVPGATPNPAEDRDGDGDSDLLEFLAGTEPKEPASRWRPRLEVIGGKTVLTVRVPANTALEIQVADTATGPETSWKNTDFGSPTPLFPASDREVSLELPAEPTTRFLRLGLRRP
jgi:hypothetical protein